MTLSCPRCNYKISIVESRENMALVEILKLAGSFGNQANLMLEYAKVRGAARPIKGGELKLLRILEDLHKIWAEESFSFNKKAHKISRSGFIWSLKTVCDKNWLDLHNNDNYLKQIMATVAEKEAARRSAEAEKNLIRKETEQRNSGTRPGEVRSGSDDSPMEKLPYTFDEYMKNRKGKGDQS